MRFWAKGDDARYEEWAQRVEADRRASGLVQSPAVLSLSGGSDKGAFSAGLLAGWSARGDRPTFDIVTGVSTGALIAPFAFLGSEEDATLTAIYTGISARDVYRQHVLKGLLGAPSLLDSKPLSQLIARYTTPDLIDRIAAEHRRGRRLLVMTTNLDAQRGVIWDMGAIAASTMPSRVDLFRQVLLASASIPAVFPPVLIDVQADGAHFSEMHVDGGVIGGFFVLPQALLSRAPKKAPPGGALYILYNGHLHPKFKIVKPRAFGIAGRALDTVLGGIDANDVDALKAFAASRSLGVAVCDIPEVLLDPKARLFDNANMRKLYAAGMQEAAADLTCLHPSVPSPSLTH